MITENTIGPFSVFFTNLNRQMQLAGHSHFATVKFTYRARDRNMEKPLGFPSFEDTHGEVQQELRQFFGEPFRDHTNEDIARAVFEHFRLWKGAAAQQRGGDYDLVAVELAVRGVPDRIGHADGFTVYVVRP
jgi:hypothetical protein